LGGTPAPGARLGAALAAGDFNGDGYPDLAAGAPGTAADTGVVWVIPGSAAGLVPANAAVYTRGALSCGTAAAGDEFGAALAAADFDGDGTSDLAIGIPGADGDRGSVCTVTGSATGPSGSKVQILARGALTAGSPAAGDRFGAALVAARLDTDARPDLAVGAPGDASSPGAVEVLKGQASGAFFGTGVALTQGDAGGTNQNGDEFGAALATGDLDGDGGDDLFVGAPGDRPASVATGGVYAFFGPVAPLNAKNAAYPPDTFAPRGLHEDGARYGASLATPDLNGDGYAELIVGEPGANGGAGRYALLRGSATGAGAGTTVDAADLGLLPTGSDAVGAALAAGDVNGDGYDDFVIGAPGARPASRPAGGQAIFVAGAGGAVCRDGGCGGACGDCALESQVCVSGACDLDYRRQAASTYPHTVDGLFTDWNATAPPPRYEWSDVPFVAADFTDVRLDYDGAALYVMNDWYINDSVPLDPGCYNLFIVYTEGGAKQWQIKLFADGAPQVFLNGEPVDPTDVGVVGAYTFGPSPLHPSDHTIFELKIPTAAGPFGAVFKDPGPGAACDTLLTEPTTFVGRALAGGGLDLAANTDVPWLFGANGASADGATVALTGVGLGGGGTATVGGGAATVLGWGPDTVLVTVPSGADSSGVRLGTASGTTNTLRFDPAPSAAVLNPKSGFTHVVDGQMTGWSVALPSHEWKDVVPVPAGAVQVYADYDDSGTLHLFFDWLDPAHPLTDAHVRGWTGGGSGVIGGPDHVNGANDGATLVQWDIIVDSGAVTVLKDGVPVSDLGAAGIAVALGAGGSLNDPAVHPGLEIDLPAGSLGFGFEITGGTDLTAPATLSTPSQIVQGVADPKSGLYVRAIADPTLLSLAPLTAPIGAVVTLEGANLGDGVGGHVTVGGGVEATASAWDPKRVTFTVPVGADTGLVRVTYGDGRRSNGLELSVTCGTGADCPSGVCTDGACEAASCTDTLRNGDESAVDCGGSCPACGDGLGCATGADCVSRVCTDGACATATCGDTVKNQGESDVDCGGPCTDCAAGKSCVSAADCLSGVCTLGKCKVATCFDGVKNQNETDVDCGGLCGPCATGGQCAVNADCAYGVCTDGECVCTPACGGKVCGADGCGGVCGACVGVQTCQSSGTVCDFVYTTVPKSGYTHTVDGQFTDWSAVDLPTFFEWYNVPAAHGAYTNAYFDFTGSKLYILNDWFFNDASPIDNGCYNLFLAYTGGGAERWQVKVYASGTVQVFKNGAIVDPATLGVTGAYGFHASPLVVDREHTIYELALPASPGRFAMQLHDPGPSSGCEVLYREPTSFVGDNTTGGGLKIAENPNVPWIPGLNPSRGLEGTLVQVYGVALGSTPGTIVFGGVTTTAETWTDTDVRVRVPVGANSSGVVITTVDGYTTNAMPFDVIASGSEPGAVLNGPSSYPHTIDGRFSDWPSAGGQRFEWDDIIPAHGQYTNAYFDFDGTSLYILNDWHANPTAPISAGCFNQFYAYTGGGSEQWDIKVYSDHVTAALNGVPMDLGGGGVEGATGFWSSPLEPTPHTIYELKIPVTPGGWGLQLHDPGGQNPGTPGFTCAGNQLSEPASFKGVLDSNGGNYVIPSTTPTIFALQPPKAAPGDTVTIVGGSLGATSGSVVFAPGVAGTVTGWTEHEVQVTVPAGVETGLVDVVTAGAVHSNGLLLRRICHDGADCESGVCLNEECQLPTCSDGVSNGAETGVDCGGASCPRCPSGQGCSSATDCVSGVCTSGVCVDPACNDGVRNGNESDVDCGGACGGCEYTKNCIIAGDCLSGRCDANQCRPSAAAVATSVPTPIGSFQLNVAVTVRVSDIGLNGVSQLRVEAPLGWLLPAIGAGGVSAKLADGTDVTGSLTKGTTGAGAHGGTWYTLTGLALTQAGANPYVDVVFAGVQAQEQTGTARWYVDVEEGLGWGRVSPNASVPVIGAIADGSGSGVLVSSPSPLPAGTPDATITVTLTNTLTDYVNTTGAEIKNTWTAYGDAAWYTSGTRLYTPTNSGQPSYFVSNDLLYDGIMELRIAALTSSDDDFIGMVFRWQDTGNFYLLDWKQTAQTSGSNVGRRGLVLRAVRNGDYDGNGVTNSNDAISDLWSTAATRVDILKTTAGTEAYWNSGWADSTWYNLRVVLDGAHMQVYVDGTLRFDVIDYTFAGGRYGPYTFSQEQTYIDNLKVYRDTITNETVTVEVPPGWPTPVAGVPPAGNLAATHNGINVTDKLTIGQAGAAAHGGTLVTATPLSVLPGEALILSFGPIQVPPYPGTETWYMRTAGVGGVLTDLALQPTLTITPAQ
ncbi:MAG: hypothetical protein CVU56_27005, partial [Deltaproteobacteria bacterium HGW-Deltaproteobacteria-14]